VRDLGILFYLFDHVENSRLRVRNLLEKLPDGTTELWDKVRSIEEQTGLPLVILH
jgi:hypothetical protein